MKTPNAMVDGAKFTANGINPMSPPVGHNGPPLKTLTRIESAGPAGEATVPEKVTA